MTRKHAKLLWVVAAGALLVAARAAWSRGDTCPPTPDCPCHHAAAEAR